jgi:hypothetical protein
LEYYFDFEIEKEMKMQFIITILYVSNAADQLKSNAAAA